MKILAIKLPPLPNKNKENEHRLTTRRAPTTKCETKVTTQNEETAQDSSGSYQQIDQSLKDIRPTTKKSVDLGRTVRIRDSFTSTKTSKKPLTSLEKVTFSEIPPKVTAMSWILYEMREGKTIYSRRAHKSRQIASLTKIINLITFLELLEKYSLNPKDIRIKASAMASSIQGTTAQLKAGAQYCLYDLFFGMMLPSGNDAAYFIAELGGYLLQNGAPADWDQVSDNIQAHKGSYIISFLKEMNYKAQKLNMTKSHFACPHGLNNNLNYSSAEDLAKLCTYAMRNVKFRKVVQTRKYQYWYTQPQPIVEEEVENQLQIVVSKGKTRGIWENTNKMLEAGWSGLKTGITPHAGPCLAASIFKYFGGREYHFLVILLDSESMDVRWEQAQNLVDWAILNRLYL